MPQFILSAPHYRLGVMYGPGEILDLPEGVTPPKSSIPVQAKPAEVPVVAPPKDQSDKKPRASDKTLI